MNKILLILLCFFCLAGFAKKKHHVKHAPKRNSKYWVPQRIITSTKNTSASLNAAELQALHRVIQSENQRINKDPYLLQAVFHSSDPVSQSAILALGRIGDPYCIETLSRVLNSKNSSKKKVAALSLGLLSTELSTKLLTQHITMETNPSLRGDFYRSLGYSRHIEALSTLQRGVLTETSLIAKAGAIEGLGVLWSGESASWPVAEEILKLLIKISQDDGEISSQAAFALSQFKGDVKLIPVSDINLAMTKTKNLWARLFLIRVLGKIEDPSTTSLLLSQSVESNPAILRIEAIKALRNKSVSDISLNIFNQTLKSNNHSLAVATLETIKFNPNGFRWNTPNVDSLFKTTKSNWVKAKALNTLCVLDKEKSRPYILEIINNTKSPVLSPALACLTLEATPESFHLVVPFLKSGDPLVISESIEQLAQLPADKVPEEIKNSLKDLVYKKDAGLVALISDLAKQMGWKEFAKPLIDVYPFYTSDDFVETKTALVTSLGELSQDATNSIFASALKDNSRQVIMAASQAIKKITGNEPNILLPLNNRVLEITPPVEQIKSSLSKIITLKTNRGNIDIRLLDDAPLTGFRFLELVNKGFYSDKKFHRLVPNFVIQGGDPRGDGFGGPGFLIRDEISLSGHERGTLGIATAGKDTGGSQFFFNLVPNYHLNGKYTVFAKVISGLEIMDSLEVGDKIISAYVK